MSKDRTARAARQAAREKFNFGRVMIGAIRRAGEKRSLRYDPAHFTLVVDEGPERQTMNLGNAFRHWCLRSRGKADDDVLRPFVRGWFTHRRKLPESFEDSRHDLLPAIRGRTSVETDRLWAQSGEQLVEHEEHEEHEEHGEPRGPNDKEVNA